MLSDPLVQEALLRVTQRLLLELLCDLMPEFLDKTRPLVGWEPSKGFNDLPRIHLKITSHRDVTADRR